MIKINSVNLVGRWVRDHECRHSASGTFILKNAIAIDRPFSRDKETDFFDITAFGKVAENTANYTGKGRLVGITGRLQQERWETDEGYKRSRVVVIANSIEFLDYADSQKSNENSSADTESYEDFQSVEIDMDDVPF